MKKLTVAALAVVVLLSLLCSEALAVHGDLTVRDVKVYSDLDRKHEVGEIAAGTSILVKEYGPTTMISVDGKDAYVSKSALLRYDITSDYMATLPKRTKVYQQADESARKLRVKRATDVYVCLISFDWALVQCASNGVYGFVKVDRLTKFRLR